MLMNLTKKRAGKWAVGIAAGICGLCVCGCFHDCPITEHPTRKVNEQFLGRWTSQDGKDKLTVGKYDAENYVVVYDGDLYHAWESDVDGVPFFSVQSLDPTQANGVYKYVYFVWRLAEDGTLRGRAVNDKIVPDATKGYASVQRLLKTNLTRTDLLGDEGVFVKDK